MKTFLAGAMAVAALLTAPAADAATYIGTRTIAGLTVNLTFVTDGTIGELDLSSLTEFQAIITGSYGGNVTFPTGVTEFSGGGLIATPTTIQFDTSKTAIFSVFGIPQGYYCIVGTGYYRGCDSSGEAEEGAAVYNLNPSDTVYREVAVGPGLVTLATLDGPGAVPEPASWAMLIAGFGLVGAVARRRRTVVAA
jgi:hypothetical protein